MIKHAIAGVYACALLGLVGCAAPPSLSARHFVDDGYAPVAGVTHGWSHFEGVGGAQIFEQHWLPAQGRPKGLFILVHGLKDHSSRYEEMAQRLVAAGFGVFALDQRGHGYSAGPRASIEDIDANVGDVARLIALARREVPEGPLFLFGHSMGGLVATLHTMERTPTPDGLILSAPALWFKTAPFEIAALGLIGSLDPNAPLIDSPDALFVRRPEAVAALANDPLVYHEKAPAKTGIAMLAGIERVWRAGGGVKVPVLAMHGGEDLLTDPKGSARFVAASGHPDSRFIFSAPSFHDLWHDPEADALTEQLIGWLEARLAQDAQ